MFKTRSAVLGAVIAMSGCAPSAQVSELTPADQTIAAAVAIDTKSAIVRVDNRDRHDLILVMLYQGQRMTMGKVPGNAVTAETIAPHFVAMGPATVQFICEPVGATWVAVSDSITVKAGEIVNLLVPARST